MATARSVRALLTSPATYSRVVFVLVGAALALAFATLDTALITLFLAADGVPAPVHGTLSALVVVLPLVVLGLAAPVRQVEGMAVAALLRVEFPDGVPAAATTWPERGRSLLWFVLHVVVGAVALVTALLLVGTALTLVVAAVRQQRGHVVLGTGTVSVRSTGTWLDAWMVPAGVLVLVATVLVVAALGGAMSRLAPRLLGPSYEERLRRLEVQTARLVERNRIAREIHDSVGHALSLIAVQAAAGRKVIGHDPAFAVDALAAIEHHSRDAAAELDHVLGVLRDEHHTSPRPAKALGLSALPALLATSRDAGLDVEYTAEGDATDVPDVVAQEAYRIVQEGLTNALRHSPDRTAHVQLVRTKEALQVIISNPYDVHRDHDRRGRGLRGIGERVQALGGSTTVDTSAGQWRLAASVPVPTTTAVEP